MLRKSRYLHMQTPNGHFNGFSVFYFQDPEDSTDVVTFAVTFCSKKDTFNRRAARDACTVWCVNGETVTCRVVDFPMELAKIYSKCFGYAFDKYSVKVKRTFANKFAWVWKYFL